MHRAKDLFGRPVVSADGGERLGEVADVLIDEDRHNVAGLVVRSGWFGGERVLPFSGVRSLGGDAVIAHSADGLIASREWKARTGATTADPAAVTTVDAPITPVDATGTASTGERSTTPRPSQMDPDPTVR